MSEIHKSDVSDNNNSGTFDPDKRIDITQSDNPGNGAGYDPDKRIDSNSTESPDKVYTDYNGKVYRIGTDLLSNNQYEINGYKYTTDDKGRIISAEGDLHCKDREGRLPIRDSIRPVLKPQRVC